MKFNEAISTVASFLKDRDEAFIMSEEQTDAERRNSAEVLITLLGLGTPLLFTEDPDIILNLWEGRDKTGTNAETVNFLTHERGRLELFTRARVGALLAAASLSAKAHPAAPVEGLDTVNPIYSSSSHICLPKGDYVARSQAEAIIAAATVQRDALIEAGLKCCNGTPNPGLPKFELALSFINSTNEARKAADIVWQDLKADNAALTARVKELGSIIEGDRTKVIDLVNAISDAFIRRSWLLTSRGSYEWDDDGFRQEFGEAMEEIGAHVDAMRAVGRDLSNCPINADEMAEARIDWRRKAKALETQLAAATGQHPYIELVLVRTASETPVPSHGGPAVYVTWELSLNGVVIESSHERYHWSDREKAGLKAPSHMQKLLVDLQAAIDSPPKQQGMVDEQE